MQRKVGTGWKSLDDTKFIDILNFTETIVITYPTVQVSEDREQDIWNRIESSYDKFEDKKSEDKVSVNDVSSCE